MDGPLLPSSPRWGWLWWLLWCWRWRKRRRGCLCRCRLCCRCCLRGRCRLCGWGCLWHLGWLGPRGARLTWLYRHHPSSTTSLTTDVPVEVGSSRRWIIIVPHHGASEPRVTLGCRHVDVVVVVMYFDSPLIRAKRHPSTTIVDQDPSLLCEDDVTKIITVRRVARLN